MDKPKDRMTISFNEAELVCVKAALYRYVKEATPGIPKRRAARLASLIKEALYCFDVQYPYEEDNNNKPIPLRLEDDCEPEYM